MAILTKKLRIGALAFAAGAVGILAVSAGSAHDALAAGSPHVTRSSHQASTDGAAFAMTNSTQGNRVVSYRRAADGSLTREHSVSTGGLGIGVDLDTQGPLRLSDDHRFLYAVNAGSDSVTVFSVHGTTLKFAQQIYSRRVGAALELLHLQGPNGQSLAGRCGISSGGAAGARQGEPGLS